VLAAAAGAGGVLGGDDDAGGASRATVTRVVDGDTVVLAGIGRSRLIGVDTPVLWSRALTFSASAGAQRR
jgi:endonuclease YncB( thermonuclease family)